MLGQAVCGDGLRTGSETWDGRSKVALPAYFSSLSTRNWNLTLQKDLELKKYQIVVCQHTTQKSE